MNPYKLAKLERTEKEVREHMKRMRETNSIGNIIEWRAFEKAVGHLFDELREVKK